MNVIIEIWSLDFVSDALFNASRLRALNAVDTRRRECLAIEVGQSLNEEDVVRVFERIKADHDLLSKIKVDNGREFMSKAMDFLAYENGVRLDCSCSERLIDYAKIESFDRRLCAERLSNHWFLSLANA